MSIENRATYSPEDNKLRLYIGRVPRDEYDKLRAEGWQTLHKQRDAGGGDFAATWTPQRRRTALEYADIIEDEDMGPAERAADRAERFGEYRDKRLDEATGHADGYDAGPQAHGFQSQARAERAARRHDRLATWACDAWSKAEYWTRRTAGVISHALYVSSPSVRMGRIKTLEAELRRIESEYTPDGGEFTYKEGGEVYVLCGQGRAKHPVEKSKLEAIKAGYAEWVAHLNLRLAYENQMLEAQGGRAAHVEIEVGGFIGGRQIHKVNKSTVTGRVVSVDVRGPRLGEGWTYGAANVPGADFALYNIETERLAPDAYRAPTPADLEELKKFTDQIAAHKAKIKASKAPCPLINPTLEEAQRLQDCINERARAAHKLRNPHGTFTPAEVIQIKQATYSMHSKGAYAKASTRGVHADAEIADPFSDLYSRARHERAERIGPAVCQVRVTGYDPVSIIVLTDKPQKDFPAAVFKPLAPKAPAFALEVETVGA